MKAVAKLFLIAVCVWAKTNAQLVTSNDVITISTGAQVTVKGDLQNNVGASIYNDGTIDLTGNWIHHAANNCFGNSQGTVVLNGASQTIGGSSQTTFNNLSLQGSNVKTLLIDATCGGVPGNGVLNVGNVVLDLNSQTMNISNSATSAITFGTGYILSEDVDNSSRVNWTINAVTGVHTIPFGNSSGVQIPLSFNLNSGNAGNLTVSTYPTAPNNTPYPVMPVLVTHVRNNAGTDNSANTVDRFYQVDVSGSPMASLTFTYAPTENATAGNSNVRAQRWNSIPLGWDLPLTGQINPTSQSVFVPNVSYYGVWALALATSPLPIELLAFTATAIDNRQVLCSWMTATEINNDYFTLERSADGIGFEEIAEIDGAGNSATTLAYSHIDYDPLKGISYYRLKQTDFDGRYSYSQTVAVRIFDSSSGILIYPNPNNGVFTVFQENEQETELSLYDVEGRLVRKDILSGHIMHFDVTDLGKGIYHLVSSTDDQIRNWRIIVQ